MSRRGKTCLAHLNARATSPEHACHLMRHQQKGLFPRLGNGYRDPAPHGAAPKRVSKVLLNRFPKLQRFGKYYDR
jgi:hypothetical protein